MLRHILTVSSMAAILIIISAAPAFADDPWIDVDCGQTPSPGCDIGVGNGGGTGNPHTGQGQTSPPQGDHSGHEPVGGGENQAVCDYRPSGYRPPGSIGSGISLGSWVDGVCSASGVIQTPEYVAALSPVEVARLARAQLRLPVPAIAANPSGDQLVTVPTWLWLSSGWQPQSA